MSKKKSYFVCTVCGTDYTKWHGRCLSCNEWNTIVEEEHKPSEKKRGAP